MEKPAHARRWGETNTLAPFAVTWRRFIDGVFGLQSVAQKVSSGGGQRRPPH